MNAARGLVIEKETKMWNKKIVKTLMAVVALFIAVVVPGLVLVLSQNDTKKNVSYADACDLEKMGNLGRVDTSGCLARATQSVPYIVKTEPLKQEQEIKSR